MEAVRRLLCLALLSGAADLFLPDGKARACVRMLAGLLAVKLVCDAISFALAKLI